MSQEQTIEALEQEVGLLKNDVKALLVDIRDRYLNYRRPFRLDRDGEAGGAYVAGHVEWLPRRANAPNCGKEADMAKTEQAASEQPDVQEEVEVGEPDKKSPSCVSIGDVRAPSSGVCKLDLVTIAGLTQWVEESVAAIGRERLEGLVEVCQMSGHLGPGIRDIILRLIRSYPARDTEGQPGGEDYLAILVQLVNLLGNGHPSETALVSVVGRRNGKRDEAWTKH